MSNDPDADILGLDDLFDRSGRWEIRTTIYRNDRKVATSDALGDSYEFCMNTVVTNLERRDVDLHIPARRKGIGR